MQTHFLRQSSKILMLFFTISCIAASAQTLIKTSSGNIEGSASSGVISFKGIPYAKPPLGDLRWKPPVPAERWSGIRKATEFGASCMQVKAGERLPWTREFMVQNKISEDCLFLNVWTPKVDRTAKLPVIVFIHGGGFVEGSGAVDVYQGGGLAAKGVVVVTINYRLGVFGFLAHPELTAESPHHSSGNYGLLDQVTALKWVKSNIKDFGGDPDRVTIWGQSAGAFSVAAMVATPLTAGLFERAQADSGLGKSGLPLQSLHDAEQSGVKYAKEHSVTSLSELRALSGEALLATPEVTGSSTPVLRFGADVDGWVLPASPNEMSAKGSDNDVAVITGYQAGDSALFAPTLTTLDEYHEMIKKRYSTMANDFERLYPVSTLEDAKSIITQSGQDRNRVSMYLWASARTQSHKSPVYTYYFDRGIPWPQHPEFGAFHTAEIPYFFLNQKLLDRPWDKIDLTLADAVSSYLIDYARHGDPNREGLATWPKVSSSKPQTMELGEHIAPMALASEDKVKFWSDYFSSPIGQNASPF